MASGEPGAAAEVRITSYFSFETDLAGEVASWPEFRFGSGYDVELSSDDSRERVTVSLVQGVGDEQPYVRVVGHEAGSLFDRVLGRVVHALAAHSDHLMVNRIS